MCGLIVRVRVVSLRTVVGDIDRRFDNLRGSHHQSSPTTILLGTTLTRSLSFEYVIRLNLLEETQPIKGNLKKNNNNNNYNYVMYLYSPLFYEIKDSTRFTTVVEDFPAQIAPVTIHIIITRRIRQVCPSPPPPPPPSTETIRGHHTGNTMSYSFLTV